MSWFLNFVPWTEVDELGWMISTMIRNPLSILPLFICLIPLYKLSEQHFEVLISVNYKMFYIISYFEYFVDKLKLRQLCSSRSCRCRNKIIPITLVNEIELFWLMGEKGWFQQNFLRWFWTYELILEHWILLRPRWGMKEICMFISTSALNWCRWVEVNEVNNDTELIIYFETVHLFDSTLNIFRTTY